MKRVASILALAFTMLLNSAAVADTTTYRATLSGPSEQPPNDSPGVSVSTVVFDDVAFTMLFSIPFSDLVAGTTVAHLHCCTPQPLIGLAPPAIAFGDFPVGVRGGLYERLFNLTDPTTYNPAFLSANGSSVDAARTALLAGINNNQSYLNIHTAAFPPRRNSRLPGGAGRTDTGAVFLADAQHGVGGDRLLRSQAARRYRKLNVQLRAVAAGPGAKRCRPKSVKRIGTSNW